MICWSSAPSCPFYLCSALPYNRVPTSSFPCYFLQAAASAALRALDRHVRIAALIQTEIALQHWMGHNVQLPKAMGEWPSPTPGWFLNVDWWRSDEDKASWT